MKPVDLAIVIFLAAIFLFSVVDKIFHYQGFLNALRNYVLVPRGTASTLAPMVIAAELTIGIGLLIAPWRRQAAIAAAALLALFTVAIALNYFYGGRGICGCWFTITLAKSTGTHLVQNLLLLSLGLSLVYNRKDLSANNRSIS
jgi:uncharacterized membrane protein YphA (DoxX/SURF4 family)